MILCSNCVPLHPGMRGGEFPNLFFRQLSLYSLNVSRKSIETILVRDLSEIFHNPFHFHLGHLAPACSQGLLKTLPRGFCTYLLCHVASSDSMTLLFLCDRGQIQYLLNHLFKAIPFNYTLPSSPFHNKERLR